ncbi:MAG TPA: HRDC domain-containing protein, partial [Acidimicrobiales bacterium]|nr:HRDC domain-containing protein [Acidimicrobiales bacterium]
MVDDAAGLADVVARLADEPRYAVDTEFHRERTYAPRLALLQLAWSDGCAVVDPLAVDVAPLASVLEGPGTAVIHAAGQDLEVLLRACDTVPSSLFDTQVAAGFLGFSTPSLATLLDRVLGVPLPKGDRLTDWLRRPLSDGQLDYAVADVAWLLALTDALVAELDATGRRVWVEEELELIRTRSRTLPDPDTAWLRLKEARSLRGKSRGVAAAVAAWRERRAASLDIPARQVLPDLAVLGIAGAMPRSLGALRAVRGVDERHLRGGTGDQLLAAVAAGRELPETATAEPRRDDVDRDLRPAVALVAAWVGQLGRDLRIDPTLLATRGDLAAFLNGDPDARLATGWRASLLGEPVRNLVDGRAALAFGRTGAGTRGGLVLEERSNHPVVVDLPVPRAPWTR